MKFLRYILPVFFIFTCYPVSISAQPVLTLDSCLQLARQNNTSIRKGEIAIERAEQVRMQALTKYFPQVQGTAVAYHMQHAPIDIGIDDIANASVRDLLLTLYGNYGAALGLDNTISLLQHGVIAGVTAIQPVFMGGKIIAGNKLAKLGVEAAELQAEITERDLLEQVEESYWLVVGLQDKRRTIEHFTALLDTMLHLVTTAVDAGLAMPQDRMQVEVKQAELRRQGIRLESGLSLATRALAQSIGVSADSIVVESGLINELAPWTNVFDMTATPEELLLALQTRAAELQRTMIIADALPKIALGANYGYSNLDANILRNGVGGWNGALFVTVSVPLTGWWEAGHKIREHSLRLEEAQLEQRGLTEKLSLRTQQAYDQMVESQLLLAEAERHIALVREQSRLAEAEYRAGTQTVADLLKAESDLLSAQNELTDATIAYRVHLRRYIDLTKQ